MCVRGRGEFGECVWEGLVCVCVCVCVCLGGQAVYKVWGACVVGRSLLSRSNAVDVSYYTAQSVLIYTFTFFVYKCVFIHRILHPSISISFPWRLGCTFSSPINCWLFSSTLNKVVNLDGLH